MYRLSLAIIVFLGFWPLFAQSPHGEELRMDCAKCHNPSSWTINYRTVQFDHDKTDFQLEGTHALTDCKLCHSSLVFSEAPMDCASCHVDIHSQSVGNDCVRCHTSETWLVDNIPELHEENGFPLIGSHSNLSCVECHTSETTLRFDRVGNECISCHRDDYAATQSPNHETGGFSTNCIECHSPLGFGWDSESINHDFFPLTQGHDIQDCAQCHTTGNYSDASPDCVSCHQDEYAGTQNPNHGTSGFSTDCVSCHTTNPGWTPAVINHDFFPLTQGHDIQDCAQCHTTTNYADASPDCVSCHQDDYAGTQNPNHGTSGFSTDCVSCHSTNPGWTPAVINHDFFPLAQGHDLQDCTQCHTTANYADASPDCVSCHQDDYAGTQNPNHGTSGFSTDCVSCHTTNPGWTPAVINHDFFPLTQGHDLQDCAQCHTTANYADASPDCVSCHQDDYDQTNNPNHIAANFPTDCVACHTTNPNWTPATFDHDAQYFPIYTGKHREGEAWDNCVECHANPASYADFTCFTCHSRPDMDDKHSEMNGYAYVSSVCLQCHPDGTKD
ncbi:hypothetical protein KO529_07215 [Arenibacter algicola]|uniref:cytochrome c3 family protein n=1 Tax=Arenibacter algicola TaxID=616991 RepID=UPI001C067A77|nr:cytochrome c3 family protein [Arenibacter algicola]MBU2904571.1 hypothetical protein [Arenibacter algicola]